MGAQTRPLPLWLLVFLSLCLVTLSNSFSVERGSNPVWVSGHRKLKPSLPHSVQKKLIDPTKISQLSWKPRAFLYKGFLSHAECDHLIDLAKDRVVRSSVARNEDGGSELSEIRTSSGTFLRKSEDDIVKGIEERIAAWTFLPPENGENIQVLRYEKSQKYDAHFDYFHDKLNIKMGGHRLATVLMYLSSVEMGGETVFPNAESYQAKDAGWSDCARQGLAVKPIKGDAILFFSLYPDATPDEHSLHAGCPVIDGIKWSATKWIHVASFDKPYIDPNSCTDDHEKCAEWALDGECARNRPYMIGEGEFVGNCRKSCNACSPSLTAN